MMARGKLLQVFIIAVFLFAKSIAANYELGSLFGDTAATICHTKQCQILADEFIRGMNQSVNPCDNFYEYTCGGWVKNAAIPKYEASWSRFSLFQQTVYHRVKGILETSPKSSDILPVRQAKKWFRSCMDVKTLEKRGLKPIESILMQLGGWPLTMDTEEWDDSEHTWQGLEHHYFHLTGSFIFYKIYTSWGDDQPGISLDRGKLPLHEQLLTKFRNYSGNDYDAYKEIIGGVALMFIEHRQADISEDRLKQDVEDLVEFEKKLYLLDNEIEEDESIEETIDQFIEWYSTAADNLTDNINFRHLIRTTYSMINYDVKDSTTLQTYSPDYWIELTKLLMETPKKTIINYIHWHFISDMLRYTTEEMRDLLFTIEKNKFDIEERAPRWLECAKEIKMTSAASFAFVEKYFPKQTAHIVREMIEKIRKEMRLQIGKSLWMDEEARQLAIAKLNDVKAIVGYPDWYHNETMVSSAYKGLTIGNEYFDSVLGYERWQIKRQLRRVNGNLANNIVFSEDLEVTVVNAFYSPFGNEIELPAADFQPPLFTSQLPWSVNYGIAGLAAGHEIGHAFDDDGIKYGLNASDTNLSKRMLDMYYDRAECFSNQFDAYYNDSSSAPHHNNETSRGLRTRGENIADSIGLHAVYEAYRKEVKDDFKLPGLEDLTDDQMFFVSFGALWCEKRTQKLNEYLNKYDSHSPGRLRVIGAVSNSNDFARAFKCPVGSLMNPTNKCDIWNSPEP